MRQIQLQEFDKASKMDDDSLNFGSPATGASPNDILSQPPLQAESTPSAQEDNAGNGEAADSEGTLVSRKHPMQADHDVRRYIDDRSD